MSRYHLTPAASQDLDDIYDYLAQRNPAAAARVIDDLRQRCRALADFPGMGRRCGELAPGLRCSPVRGYIIVYRPTDDGVEIVRIVHGARNLPALFQP